jgi:hypothetical protein
MTVFSNMCYEFSEVRRGVEIIAEADVDNCEVMTPTRLSPAADQPFCDLSLSSTVTFPPIQEDVRLCGLIKS